MKKKQKSKQDEKGYFEYISESVLFHFYSHWRLSWISASTWAKEVCIISTFDI